MRVCADLAGLVGPVRMWLAVWGGGVVVCCNIALTFPCVKTASNALSARIRL